MNDQKTKEWRRGAWRVVADRRQVFDNDPGQGTRNSSATMNCALDTGECDSVSIPDGVYEWLEDVDEQAYRFVFGD